MQESQSESTISETVPPPLQARRIAFEETIISLFKILKILKDW